MIRVLLLGADPWVGRVEACQGVEGNRRGEVVRAAPALVGQIGVMSAENEGGRGFEDGSCSAGYAKACLMQREDGQRRRNASIFH